MALCWNFILLIAYKVINKICTKQKFHIGNMVQLLPNMFWEVVALIKWFVFNFQMILYDHFA